MRITIIFPGRAIEAAKATASVMPLAPTLLAALTPEEHDISLVDMFHGDEVAFDAEGDLFGITVRTPLAPIAYDIADRLLERGKKVVLGGPHVFTFPAEAKEHASSVAIGEAEELWPKIVRDAERGELRGFYVAGPYRMEKLAGSARHVKRRPSLAGLPMMRRDLLPRDRYMMDSLFTTRGCPNRCRFCPVTRIFGGKIRHRPVDEVVAEVETLGERYYNFDDSVFGHPQLVDRPEENQYYLDLYAELAGMRPKRRWTGAGGLSAVSYRDGRRILELAAESGLSAIAAGLESVTVTGQKASGAWRKLHCSSPDAFDVETTKEQIRLIQSLGIEVHGFFVVGWDDDTVETYKRTLHFCDETGIVPFIFTLRPMPGSDIYDEYLEGGRILTDLPWDAYGGPGTVFVHPHMTVDEMLEANEAVMREAYSTGRILARTLQAAVYRGSLDAAKASYFTQQGLRRGYLGLYEQARRARRGSSGS